MECKYCKKEFKNNYILNSHQKTAKYCLKLRGINIKKDYECNGCLKHFIRKDCLRSHMLKCKSVKIKYNFTEELEDKDKIIENLKYELRDYESKYTKCENQIRELQTEKNELFGVIIEIATSSVSNDKDKIKQLTDRYVKKRERKQYMEENVIYILTTPSLKKDRRYIMGKASNLTNRLSTYNKSDEHEVVFHISCGSKEDMSTVEPMVFNKLKDFREQANRERFILPENKDIDFFIQKIKDCVNFLK